MKSSTHCLSEASATGTIVEFAEAEGVSRLMSDTFSPREARAGSPLRLPSFQSFLRRSGRQRGTGAEA